MKKVSLIVPVYNAGKYLENTVDNLLLQAYGEIEYIFINDGSKDNSFEILNNFQRKDNRIIVIDKDNGGPSSARNIGIKRATGDYITFCDADDLLDVTFLTDMINKLSDKDYDLISSSFNNVVYKKNKVVSTTIVRMEEKELLNSNEVKTFYLHGIINSYTHSPICKLYKSSIIKNYNIQFDENMLFGEDLLFNLDYIDKCNSAYNIKKSYYDYIQIDNPNRLTQRKDIDKFCVYYLWRKKLNEFINDIDCDKKNKIVKILKNQWFISGVNSINESEDRVKYEIKKYLDYNPIVNQVGIKNFIVSLMIASKSTYLILLFSRLTMTIKQKFKPLYYKIMAK